MVFPLNAERYTSLEEQEWTVNLKIQDEDTGKKE